MPHRLEIARAAWDDEGGGSKLVDRLVKIGPRKKSPSANSNRRFRTVELTERAEELVRNFGEVRGPCRD